MTRAGGTSVNHYSTPLGLVLKGLDSPLFLSSLSGQLMEADISKVDLDRHLNPGGQEWGPPTSFSWTRPSDPKDLSSHLWVLNRRQMDDFLID
jgi:hypothetical protein